MRPRFLIKPVGLQDPVFNVPHVKPQSVPDAAHEGSERRYNAWGCRCGACVEFHEKKISQRRSNKECGTLTKYLYGCRCVECRKANATASREYAKVKFK